MKEQVKDMFAQVSMPEELEQQIRSTLAQRGRWTQKPVGRRLAAAVAVLVLVLCISPRARAAAEDMLLKYFWPDSDISLYETRDENGNVVDISGMVDTEAPAFARMVNERLYFLGNGEKIDITDQITEETPYYYTYVDDYGLTHYMAVGYTGTMDNFGIYEFIREESGKWITGTGRNFLCNETETRYPWVDLVWAEWDIPWPMPE